MSEINVGDKVRYVGPVSQWLGQEGTAKETVGLGTKVIWETGAAGWPDTKNLRLVKPGLNPNKPLEFVSGTNVADAPLIAESKGGEIIVGRSNGEIAHTMDWAVFDAKGKFIKSSNGQGTGLTLRNKLVPEEVHGTVTNGAHTWDVKVTHVDGEASKVEFV